ncbi:MAG: SPOR domain-containing protein [Neomegalonema sp.]|nr:SPOR domain-containing protein [Neomegalonema sp.]
MSEFDQWDEAPARREGVRGVLTTTLYAAGSLAVFAGVLVWAYQLGDRNLHEIPALAANEAYKRPPADPGGKQFPNQDRQVYSQFDNGAANNGPASPSVTEPAERPTQEDVAVARMIRDDAGFTRNIAASLREQDEALRNRVVDADTFDTRVNTQDVGSLAQNEMPTVTPVFLDKNEAIRPSLRQPIETASIAPQGEGRIVTPSPASRAQNQAARSDAASKAPVPKVVRLAPSAPAPQGVQPNVRTALNTPPPQPNAVMDTAPADPREAITAPSVAAAPLSVEKELATVSDLAPQSLRAPGRREQLALAAETQTSSAPAGAQRVKQSSPSAAALPPAQQLAQQPRPQAPTGPVYQVQLAALESEDAVRRRWSEIQKANPDLFRGFGLDVQSVEVRGERLYRMRVGPMSGRAEADQLCAALKQRGKPCFVAVKK